MVLELFLIQVNPGIKVISPMLSTGFTQFKKNRLSFRYKIFLEYDILSLSGPIIAIFKEKSCSKRIISLLVVLSDIPTPIIRMPSNESQFITQLKSQNIVIVTLSKIASSKTQTP
jgi:hypothetical protein